MKVEIAHSLSSEFLEAASRLIECVWPGQSGFFKEDVAVQHRLQHLFESFYAFARKDEKEFGGLAVSTTSGISTELRTITWLVVHPEIQGNGLGTNLVKACIDYRLTCDKDILLGTGRPNLFISLGFEPISTYTPYSNRHLMLYKRKPETVLSQIP
jgi:GNAT superfamily N-acetyltransferase